MIWLHVACLHLYLKFVIFFKNISIKLRLTKVIQKSGMIIHCDVSRIIECTDLKRAGTRLRFVLTFITHSGVWFSQDEITHQIFFSLWQWIECVCLDEQASQNLFVNQFASGNLVGWLLSNYCRAKTRSKGRRFSESFQKAEKKLDDSRHRSLHPI